MIYGKELILDLHDCDVNRFNRSDLGEFFDLLCNRIGMSPEDRHYWDDLDIPETERETEPHLVGTSAIQFIKTSNVTVHTLDLMARVYINIFSCRDFDGEEAAQFCCSFFDGQIANRVEVTRV